jgi:hypothetical protein
MAWERESMARSEARSRYYREETARPPGHAGMYRDYGGGFTIGGRSGDVPAPGLIIDPFRPWFPGGAGETGTPAGSNDLQVLLSALPTAQQGDVITPDYHNSLRAAILLLARRIGVEMAGGGVVLTFAPSFSPDGAKTPWASALGVARKPSTGTTAGGWLALQLPDDVRIDGMTVVGRRSAAGVTTFSVKLVRQALNGGQAQFSLVELVSVSPEAGEPFTTTRSVEIPRLSPATVEELRSVNNRQFKYLVTADLEFTEAATAAEIHAIQIVCSK